MGYLWGLFDKQPTQPYGFIPCAPGCRGSSSNPRYCHCVCQGINHGLLLKPVRIERPVPIPHGYNPSIPLLQEPEHHRLPDLTREMTVEEKRQAIAKLPETRLYHATGKLTRKVGRSFAKAMLGTKPSETELNQEIVTGLRKQFSQERVDGFIDEAFAEYFDNDPDRPRPELYELYETGLVDHAIERQKTRWVVGRPKRKS
jgi:hypothetical protein